MNDNIFNKKSPLFEFRWFMLIALIIMGIMAWYDMSGGRMFSTDSQEQWSSNGPGYHK